MENYKKIVKRNIDAIINSEKKLKDIYNVMLLHSGHIAYERLVDYEVEEVTYAALDLEIRAFAAYMRHTYPDAAGEYVGIDLANGPGFLIAFWGVLMSGGKPYLINSFYPADLRARLLKRLDAGLVITAAADYTDFTVISMDYDKNCQPISDGFWQNEFALSSTLTGLQAKMCVFDGETVVNQILNAQDILKTNNWLMKDYQKRIKIAMILPLFHIFGIMVSYFWFAFFGRTMVFFKDNSPDTIRGTINRHKVTHIFAPPILFHKLYKGIMSGLSQESERRRKKFRLGTKIAFALQNIFPGLGIAISRKLFKEVLALSFGPSPQFMISGGAYIESEALRTINCLGYPLFNGYGTTETAITGANLAKKIRRRVDGSIGSPFKSVNYTFNEDGTLVVSGSTICKKIISLTGEESGFDRVETNDIIKEEKGRYFIAGRKSDLYIGENGENISPDTIQNQLKVKNATRFSVLELDGRLAIVLEYGERMPVAVISKEIEQVKNALAEITYGQYVKDIFVSYQAIANPNAIKVSRALLRRRADEGEVVLIDYKNLKENVGQQTGKDGQTEDSTMFSIKQAFKYAIDADTEILANSDFFIDLGGTSLDYFMLLGEMESIFNIKINVEKNRNLRTPECFYKYIAEVL